MGSHRRCRAIGVRLEVDGGAGVGVDGQATPRRTVVEHDLSGVLGRDPAMARDLAGGVGESDRRRERDHECHCRCRPATQTREPLTGGTAYVIVGDGRVGRRRVGADGRGPAEHQGVSDDVGAQRVEIARVALGPGGPGDGIRALHRGDDLVGVVDHGEHPEPVDVDLCVGASTPSGCASPLACLAVGSEAGAREPLAEEAGGGRSAVLEPEHGVDDAGPHSGGSAAISAWIVHAR